MGLLTYDINDKNECEIVTLNSLTPNKGIGTALIEAVKKEAKEKNCQRLWLVTTNDNTQALKFYQKRGFHIVSIYPDAIEESRKLKPSIPEIGINEIPIRDEIELELSQL